MNSYEKTIARMESEVKRAQARLLLMKALYAELKALDQKNEKNKA